MPLVKISKTDFSNWIKNTSNKLKKWIKNKNKNLTSSKTTINPTST